MAEKSWHQEHDGASHMASGQEAQKGESWHSVRFLLFIKFRTSAHKRVPPTVIMGLPNPNQNESVC